MSAATPKEAMAAFVRFIMRDVTYHKHYLATVMSQAGARVDIRPDDQAIAGSGLSGVALDTIPGVDATVPAGAKVTLYFANGDPQQPRCRWVEGTPVSLVLAGGTMPVARVGDNITITTATSVTGGAVTGSGIITGGAPLVKA